MSPLCLFPSHLCPPLSFNLALRDSFPIYFSASPLICFQLPSISQKSVHRLPMVSCPLPSKAERVPAPCDAPSGACLLCESGVLLTLPFVILALLHGTGCLATLSHFMRVHLIIPSHINHVVLVPAEPPLIDFNPLLQFINLV